MYKRVNGERFVAAILDGIVVSIVGMIPIIIYLFTAGWASISEYMVDGGGFLEDEGWYNTFMLIAVLTETIIGVVYFVYMPFKMNGQTLGKRLMKIKAIDEFGNNPSLKQHFIRAIQNWGTYVTALTFFIFYINVTAYSLISGGLAGIVGILAFISYLMILIKEDGRGIHDLITETRVVKSDVDLNKMFVEKTTQMGEWAEVVGESGKTEKSEDPWAE